MSQAAGEPEPRIERYYLTKKGQATVDLIIERYTAGVDIDQIAAEIGVSVKDVQIMMIVADVGELSVLVEDD